MEKKFQVDIMDIPSDPDDFKGCKVTIESEEFEKCNVNEDDDYIKTFIVNTNKLLTMTEKLFNNINNNIGEKSNDMIQHQINLITVMTRINSNFKDIKRMLLQSKKEDEKKVEDIKQTSSTTNNYYLSADEARGIK